MVDELEVVSVEALDEQVTEPNDTDIFVGHKPTLAKKTYFAKWASIKSWILKTGAIVEATLASGCVTRNKIGAKAVGQGNIDDEAVGFEQIEDGCIDSQKIANKGITGVNIDDGAIDAVHLQEGACVDEIENYHGIVYGKNLFNKDAAGITIDDKYIHSTYVIISYPPSPGAENYGITDYIAVLPNTTYTITNPLFLSVNQLKMYFDASKVQLASPNNGHAGNTFTTPAGCYFIRFSLYTAANKASYAGGANIQLELGATATTYEAYSRMLDGSDIKLPDNSIGTGMLQDHSVTLEKIDPDALGNVEDGIKAYFGTTPGKNLFNKNASGITVDDKYIHSSYAIISYPPSPGAENYGITDFIAVLPNTTYTITNPLYASGAQLKAYYDASKVALASPNAGHAGNTFTTPAGCYYVRFSLYTAANKASYDGGANIQLELGSTATAYEAYVDLIAESKIKIDKAPSSYSVDKQMLSGNVQTGGGQVIVYRTGNYLWIRSKFNDTYDSLSCMIDTHCTKMGFYYEYLIPKTNSYTDVTTGRIIAKSSTDDTSPLYVNGTQIGGGHGLDKPYKLTKTSHGFTYADIGSVWRDGKSPTPNEYAIMSIIDANNIVVLGKNESVTDVWSFQGAITGATLTEVGGAGRTFTGWTASTTQLNLESTLVPHLVTPSVTILLDGVTPITTGVAARCSFVDVIVNYNIINPVALRNFVTTNAGTFTANVSQAQADALQVFIKNYISYRFQDYGACVIDYTVEFMLNTSIGYLGFMQAITPYYSGSEVRKIYAPRVKSSVARVNSRLLTFATLDTEWQVGAADMNDEHKWTDRIVQIIHTSSVDTTPLRAFVCGYSLEYGQSKQEDREANCTVAWNLGQGLGKNYPRVVNTKVGTVAAGTVYCVTAYRQLYLPNHFSANATSVYFNEQNGKLYIYADYHSTVVRDRIVLPRHYAGKAMTVVDKTANVTLHSDDYLPAGGIIVSADCSIEVYGYIILKVDL